jgi:hypothetical protein
LFVPHDQLITLELAFSTPIGKKMNKLIDRLLSPKHSFLGAYLLQEKKKPLKDRYFHPFLEILPQECTDFPIFFDKETLSYLKGSPFEK